MKKSKLLLLAALTMLSSINVFAGVKADEKPVAPTAVGSDPVTGDKYYIMNVEAKKFLNAAKVWFSWATSAGLSDDGQLSTVTLNDGKWTITRSDGKGTFISGSGKTGKQEMHVDGATPGSFVFTKQSNGNYYITADGSTGTSWGWLGAEHTYPNAIYADIVPSEAPTAASVEWLFLTEENYSAYKTAYATYLSDLTEWEKSHYKVGDDVTSLIVNPGATGNTNGWTCNKPKGGGGPLKPSGDAFEFWGGSASPRAEASFDYYQTITGLQNGVYTITCQAYNSLNGEAGATFNASCCLYGVGGSDEKQALVDVEGEVLSTYSVDVTVINGTLTLGVKSVAQMGARWFVADNFTLKYKEELSDPLAAFKEGLENAVSNAKQVNQNAPMNSSVLSTLSGLIKTNDNGKTYDTEAAYNAAISSINDAVSAANTSINNYAQANTFITGIAAKVDALDAAGKAAYDDDAYNVAKKAYDKGTLESLSDAQKSEMNAAFVAAVKAQTTAGSDMTAVIANPGGETNSFSPWVLVRDGNEVTNSGLINNGGNAHDGTHLFETAGWGPRAASMTQSIELNAGKYTLSAYRMASTGSKAWLQVLDSEDGEIAIGEPSNGTGDTGDDRWAQVSVTFNIGSTQTVKIMACSSTEEDRNWANFDDFSLVRTGDYEAPAAPEITVTDGDPITAAKSGATVSYTRNFGNTEWQGLYVPYAITAEAAANAGVTIAQVTDVTVAGGAVTFNIEKVTTASAANAPLFVKAASTGNATISMTGVEVVTPNEAEQTIGDGTFRGVVTAEWAEFGGSDYYALAGGQLCKGASGVKLPINRWGVKFATALGSKLRINFSGDFNVEDATAIADMISNATGAKSYTINGVKANANAKGIIINNGKKIYVK